MTKPAAPPAPLLLIVDLQRVFAETTPWIVPALPAILPNVRRLIAHFDPRIVLSTHMPPAHPSGTWERYYRRWAFLPARPELTAVIAELQHAGSIVEKVTYSCFGDPAAAERLRLLNPAPLIVAGVETDICVLATVLDAVDLGIAVAVVEDAVASADAAAHKGALAILRRIPEQVRVTTTGALLAEATAVTTEG